MTRIAATVGFGLLTCGCLLRTARTESAPAAPAVVVRIAVDVSRDRHPIDPRIYGVAFAGKEALDELNAPLNRNGGNATTCYNWKLNAANRANDWFFESIAEDPPVLGGSVDAFIAATRAGGAEAMLTIPTLGWVAKVGPNREKLCSFSHFSQKKYGPQAANDAQYFPDAGNGIRKSDNQPITGNDPNDANVKVDPAFQAGWVKHLVGKWGAARKGGVRYYFLDNEPSIWHSTHRDVQPHGLTLDELGRKTIEYAGAIKAADPGAVVMGPEEWGWTGYLYSGADQEHGSKHGWSDLPDRKRHGGMEAMPWLLSRFKEHQDRTGKRLLDFFTLHIYPQGGEYGNDTSEAMQLRRNRSTRALWDPSYVDETWIKEKVRLIPRMKEWVRTHYPGTPIGITEYNWGAENHINGATAQADVLGIFGREGLDLANRWTTPETSTPTFKAMKLFRNYDGKKSGFGDTSVECVAPNPDQLSAFAARRSADDALTLMVVNKQPGRSAQVSAALSGFAHAARGQVWQLTAANRIERLADVAVSTGRLSTTVPAQSITLIVVPGR
jgi:hypothetical protein